MSVKLLFSASVFFLCSSVMGQIQNNTKRLNNDEIIFFTKKYDFPFQYNDDIVRIDLSSSDILKLDKLMEEQYSTLSKWRISFKKTVRLYIAFKDNSGRKAIVEMLKMNSKTKRKKFQTFRKEFQLGFGEYYEEKSVLFIIFSKT